jgi:methyl halide transferase
MTASVGEPAFWRDLYTRGEDRWDLGRPSPALEAHLARSAPPPGRVAVLGCGRGHDCRLLARHGYQVWGFDFTPEPLAAARALAQREGLDVRFEERDIFTLAESYPAFFDAIWEYTCFCAIDPARRGAYADLVPRLLRPGGFFLAAFFPMVGAPSAESPPEPSGPPFPVTEAEVRRLFEPRFQFLEAYVPTASAEGRQDREWMVFARLRADPVVR